MTDCEHWPVKGPLPSWESVSGDECNECSEECDWVCLVCLSAGKQMLFCKRHVPGHHRIASHAVFAKLQSETIWCAECKSQVSTKDERAADFDPVAAYNNPEGGRMGLVNLENTCFFNSGVQALLHCPPLVAYFLTLDVQHLNLAQPKEALAKEFASVVRKDWVPSQVVRAHVPRELLRAVLRINQYFRGFGQHDAQELLRCILDTLHEALQIRCEYDYLKFIPGENADEEKKEAETARTMSGSDTENSQSEVSKKVAKKAAKKTKESPPSPTPPAEEKQVEKVEGKTENNPEKEEEKKSSKPHVEASSVISDLFQGQLLSEITCLKCGSVSVKQEPFYDLSLELPKEKTLKKVEQERGHVAASGGGGWLGLGTVLQYVGLMSSPIAIETCLHSFCVSEELLKGDQYKCEKCKEKVDAKKTLAISVLPEILCLHIKRFAHNSYYGSKVSRQVTFPVNSLDMSPFCKALAPPATTKKKRKSKVTITDGTSNYDLFAMVRHQGSSGGGHYLAYTKSHVTQQWYRFSDHEVSQVTEDQIAKQEAYVLFYRRQADVASQRTVRELAEAGKAGPELNCFVSLAWLRKIEFMSHGCPVDNRTLFCPHGHEHSREELQKRAVPFALTSYHRLIQRFGGGPVAMGQHESSVGQRCAICGVHEEKTKIFAIDAQAPRGKGVGIIHKPWLVSWNAYVSSNGPRPGPISNHLLCEEEGEDKVKPNLVKEQDYQALKEAVWEALLAIYGGGPPILRETTNLYPEADREANEDTSES